MENVKETQCEIYLFWKGLKTDYESKLDVVCFT